MDARQTFNELDRPETLPGDEGLSPGALLPLRRTAENNSK
jgi:hypothetical protein